MSTHYGQRPNAIVTQPFNTTSTLKTSKVEDFSPSQGSQTWVDGDSYVGAWSGGARSGWGATYWNNGNAHEGGNAGGGGAMHMMHGQGLHFKWGDGAAFRCRTMAHCFERDALVRANGTFRYARKVK